MEEKNLIEKIDEFAENPEEVFRRKGFERVKEIKEETERKLMVLHLIKRQTIEEAEREALANWEPKTKLGKEVNDGK